MLLGFVVLVAADATFYPANYQHAYQSLEKELNTKLLDRKGRTEGEMDSPWSEVLSVLAAHEKRTKTRCA